MLLIEFVLPETRGYNQRVAQIAMNFSPLSQNPRILHS
jgi:hypothetical protein